MSNSADRPVIRGNTSRGNRQCGIHINGDASQGGDGIISGARIENNLISDNGRGGGSGINCDGVQDSKIQNNLLYENHSSGISLYRVDGAAGFDRQLCDQQYGRPGDGFAVGRQHQEPEQEQPRREQYPHERWIAW